MIAAGVVAGAAAWAGGWVLERSGTVHSPGSLRAPGARRTAHRPADAGMAPAPGIRSLGPCPDRWAAALARRWRDLVRTFTSVGLRRVGSDRGLNAGSRFARHRPDGERSTSTSVLGLATGCVTTQWAVAGRPGVFRRRWRTQFWRQDVSRHGAAPLGSGLITRRPADDLIRTVHQASQGGETAAPSPGARASVPASWSVIRVGCTPQQSASAGTGRGA